jgi:hypothetical protein
MTSQRFSPALLSGNEAEAIHEALLTSGYSELAELISQKTQRTESDRKYAATVRSFEDGVFEMDDAPVVSSSEDGAFVMVWQWVDAAETRNLRSCS